MMSGTSAQTDASPAGTMRRLGANVGGAAASFPIVLASGIWGVVWNDARVDASGNLISPAVPTGKNPQVEPTLALPSYSSGLSLTPPIAGAQRPGLTMFLANQNNYFIQRHKQGTRVNVGLVGKQCALTYNATRLEFEVDSTAGNPTVVIEDVPQFFGGSPNTFYDSSTFATDALGAFVVFRFLPSVQAQPGGLTYAS